MQVIYYHPWRRILSRGSEWQQSGSVPHYLTRDQQQEWLALQQQFGPVLSAEQHCDDPVREPQPVDDPTAA
jgi:hypothetical protein